MLDYQRASDSSFSVSSPKSFFLPPFGTWHPSKIIKKIIHTTNKYYTVCSTGVQLIIRWQCRRFETAVPHCLIRWRCLTFFTLSLRFVELFVNNNNVVLLQV